MNFSAATDDVDQALYYIVVNAEQQHSIWRADSPCPEGWTHVGAPASKDECLQEIERVWTDIRPLSAR